MSLPGSTARTLDSSPTEEALVPLNRSLGSWVFVTWVTFTFVGAAWYMLDQQAIFFLSGCAACVIVSLPLVNRRTYDLLSPWSLVLVAGYLGYGVRGLFITLGINGSRTVEELYLLGQPPEYFVRPSVLFLIGLGAFTAGYLTSQARRRSSNSGPKPSAYLESRTTFGPLRITIAVLVLAGVGLFAFYMFAQGSDGLSLDRISGKRAARSGLELESSYRSNGEWRVLNSFSAIALWLQVAHYASAKVPHGLFSPRGWWLGILFVNAALLPVYASTRADVVFIIVIAILVEFCVGDRKVNWRVLAAALVVTIALSAALTALRDIDHGTATGEESFSLRVVDTFVLTRTFSDIPTTSHVIEAVPETLDYAHGETVTSWLAAPIPRRVWPEKPIISVGPTLGVAIYGNARSGVPPGLIAESYWNFGFPGLILLPGVCGWFIGALYRRFAATAFISAPAGVLVAAVALRPGFDLVTNSIGYALFQLVQGLALLCPVLWFVTRRQYSPSDHRFTGQSEGLD